MKRGKVARWLGGKVARWLGPPKVGLGRDIGMPWSGPGGGALGGRVRARHTTPDVVVRPGHEGGPVAPGECVAPRPASAPQVRLQPPLAFSRLSPAPTNTYRQMPIWRERCPESRDLFRVCK